MAIRLACRIQHHASRAALLDDLLPRLAGLDDVQVVTDPGGTRPSTWRTHRLCLEAIPADASHLLVCQDDALPVPGFAGKILAAVAEHPTRIIAAFAPGVGHIRRRFAQAQLAGERWIEMPQTSFIPLVCTIYPREHALAIPAFADKKRISVGRADDAVVGTYARAIRTGCICLVPCLADHDDTAVSLMKMPNGQGHAHRLAAAL